MLNNMKICSWIIVTTIVVLAMQGGCVGQIPASGINNTPKIIFDTDMGPDYDDIGAIAMLHALADNKECEILGTISCVTHPSIAPTIEIFNRYFNRPDLPIGVPAEGAPAFTAANNWNDTIINAYAPEIKNKVYPAAVNVYRKILSEQPDNSVTIVTVGFLSNIRDLLNSGPDRYSALTGVELVSAKVKQLVCMGGEFPQGNEFNINKDASAAVETFEKWPVPILFSGFEIGSRIFTGGRVAESGKNSPVVKGYQYNLKTYKKEAVLNRQSWDQTTVLIAVRDADKYFYVCGPGKFMVSDNGANTWNPDAGSNHYFIAHKYPYSHLEKIIEDLMLYTPPNR